MTTLPTGGCQCGRIRYAADTTEAKPYLCHCKMCRRATGGAAAAFVNLPLAAVRWEREPDWYRSSAIAERPFCAACGTPFGFRFVEGAKDIDVTLGSFDDPSGFVPAHNFGSESILPAWQDTSHLPGVPTSENAGLVKKWTDAGLPVPD